MIFENDNEGLNVKDFNRLAINSSCQLEVVLNCNLFIAVLIRSFFRPSLLCCLGDDEGVRLLTCLVLVEDSGSATYTLGV